MGDICPFNMTPVVEQIDMTIPNASVRVVQDNERGGKQWPLL